MAKYRTALGKVVDMSTLAAKNERTRAVGNMKVNARGDTIDSMGKIIKPATAKVNEAYAKTVGNRSAQVQRSKVVPNPSTVAAQRPASPRSQPDNNSKPVRGGVNAKIEESIESVELTESERELADSFDDDIEVEQIKAKEVKASGKK